MLRYSEASAPLVDRRQIIRKYAQDKWPRIVRYLMFVVLLLGAVHSAPASEVIPPSPARHFNDYTNTVSASDAQAIDAKLQQFEKDTSNQVLVVIYPTMQSDSSIDDYCVRVAQRWKVGTKEHRNGVVVFIFKNDHKIWITVGYGLEGALPDITAKQIIDNDITPRFKAGDFAGGVNAGVDSIIAATKGEYKAKPASSGGAGSILPIIIFIVILILILRSSRRGGFGWGPFIYTGGWGGRGGGGWSGGGWGGGSWGGGGGGGFSGGGGSFGGGGAGGSW